MRRAALLAAIALAACLAGCGKEPSPAPAPAAGWREAKVEGIEHASGVTAWRDRLLFTSSTAKAMYEVRVDEVKDGATVRARTVPLGVDEGRQLMFSSPTGARSFRMDGVWAGEQRLSGLCVVEPELLYVVSESYRVVWFGPLEVARDGSPVRCRFERAYEVPGANRSKAEASDWHDYGDSTASDGIAGVCAAGEDVAVVSRGKGSDRGLAYRLDRMSVERVALVPLPFPSGEAPGTRWWSDISKDGAGYLLALARRPADGSPASTRVLRLARIDMADLVHGGPSVETALDVPASDAGDTAEGLFAADGRLWLVSGDGSASSPTRLRWRPWP